MNEMVAKIATKKIVADAAVLSLLAAKAGSTQAYSAPVAPCISLNCH